MVADIALKERLPLNTLKEPRVIRGDNDNQPKALLTSQEVSPLALEAARRLISHHTAQTPVVIKSWGTPEIVYGEIRQKLINFGYQIDMAENMADKLVDHALEHAEASRSKYGANLIALKIEVSRAKPSAQFETGALEVQRIDGHTNTAQVAGATSVAVGINTGGTFTTALRDGVGEIMEMMAGANNAVWVHFEAPNKSELQGVANEAAMAAIAAIAGGALLPEQVQELMQQMNMLVEAGLIAPELASAILTLNQIQIQAVAGNFDGIKDMSQSVLQDLGTALENGSVSTEILQAMVEVMQLVSDKYGLQSVMDIAGLNQLKQDVLKAVVTEKLEVIAGNLETIDQEALKALIDEMADLEGAELHQHLDKIDAQLQELGVEVPEIAELKNLVVQNMPLDQRIEFLISQNTTPAALLEILQKLEGLTELPPEIADLADLAAEDLLEILQQLSDIEQLPPEVAELLDKLDIQNLSAEDLKAALAGQGDPALVEAVQGLIVEIQNPEVQQLLPEVLAEKITQFTSEHSQLTEAITTKVEVSRLLQDIDVANLTVEALQAAIAGNGDPALAEALQNFIVQIQNPEIKALMPEGIGDRVTQFLSENSLLVEAVTTKAVISEMSAVLAEMDASSPEAAKITQAIERLEAGESIAHIDPSIMKAIIDKLDAPAAAKMDVVVKLAEQKIEAARIVGEVITNPTLSSNPEIMKRIEELEAAKGTEIKGAIDAVKAATALATYGNNPITNKPAFSPAVVVQQLSMIIQNITASSTPASTILVSGNGTTSSQPSPEQKVTKANLEAVAKVVEKFTSNQQVKINDVIGAVQKLNNEIAKLLPAKLLPQITTQLQSIKDKLIQILPQSVRKDQKVELQRCSGSPCNCLTNSKNPAFNPAAKVTQVIETAQGKVKITTTAGELQAQDKAYAKAFVDGKADVTGNVSDASLNKMQAAIAKKFGLDGSVPNIIDAKQAFQHVCTGSGCCGPNGAENNKQPTTVIAAEKIDTSIKMDSPSDTPTIAEKTSENIFKFDLSNNDTSTVLTTEEKSEMQSIFGGCADCASDCGSCGDTGETQKTPKHNTYDSKYTYGLK